MPPFKRRSVQGGVSTHSVSSASSGGHFCGHEEVLKEFFDVLTEEYRRREQVSPSSPSSPSLPSLPSPLQPDALGSIDAPDSLFRAVRTVLDRHGKAWSPPSPAVDASRPSSSAPSEHGSRPSYTSSLRTRITSWGSKPTTQSAPFKEPLSHAVFTPDGARAVVASPNKTEGSPSKITILEPAQYSWDDGLEIRSSTTACNSSNLVLKRGADRRLQSLAATNELIAVGSQAGFELYKAVTREGEPKPAYKQPSQDIKDEIRVVALYGAENGEHALCIATGGGQLRHWQVQVGPDETCVLSGERETDLPEPGKGYASAICYNKNGKQICVGMRSGAVHLFELPEGSSDLKKKTTFSTGSFGDNHNAQFRGLAFVDDSRIVAGIYTSGGDGGRFPAVYRMTQEPPREDRLGNRTTVSAVAVSPTGKQIAFVAAKKVKVFVPDYKNDPLDWARKDLPGREKLDGMRHGDTVAVVWRSEDELLVMDSRGRVVPYRWASQLPSPPGLGIEL